MTPVFFKYRTPNLGDDLQSAALAQQVLPDVTKAQFIDRDFPERDMAELPDDAVLFASGWMALRDHHPGFELPSQVHSIHLNYRPETVPLGIQKWLRTASAQAPVGCRDLWTRWVLTQLGIPARFSPCPTMALERPKGIERTDAIVMADATPSASWLLDLVTETATHQLTPKETASLTHHDRMFKVGRLLNTYASARGVITSRLHAFLPCVAMGTPVYFVDDDRDTTRFGGYEALMAAERLRFERMFQ